MFLWDSDSNSGLENLVLQTPTLILGPKSDSDSDSSTERNFKFFQQKVHNSVQSFSCINKLQTDSSKII